VSLFTSLLHWIVSSCREIIVLLRDDSFVKYNGMPQGLWLLGHMENWAKTPCFSNGVRRGKIGELSVYSVLASDGYSIAIGCDITGGDS
jgi:hypothetical protein